MVKRLETKLESMLVSITCKYVPVVIPEEWLSNIINFPLDTKITMFYFKKNEQSVFDLYVYRKGENHVV